MVLGGGAPRDFAESELRLAFNMGRKIIEIPKENEGFWGSWGGDAPGASAESEPRVTLRMGRKIIEIPQENEGKFVGRGS